MDEVQEAGILFQPADGKLRDHDEIAWDGVACQLKPSDGVKGRPKDLYVPLFGQFSYQKPVFKEDKPSEWHFKSDKKAC